MDMNEKNLGALMKAFQDYKTMKELDHITGELFAMMCVADIKELEKRTLDAIVLVKSKGIVGKELQGINKMSVLLGCLARFHDDLLENTQVAKDCKKTYEDMKASGELPNT